MIESSSSDIANKIKHIQQLDAELSISPDQSVNVDGSNINASVNQKSNIKINRNSNFDLNIDEDDLSNNTNTNTDSSSAFQDGSEKISKFCAAFNKKVGVSTNSLEEVLEIVDVLINNHVSGTMLNSSNSLEVLKVSEDTESLVQKLRNRITKLKTKNKELQSQVNSIEMQNSSLQADLDQLKYQNNRLEETLADMQIRLQSSQQEVKDLNDRSSRNKNSREEFESTVSNLGDLIQTQLDDSTTIISQRDSLIKIINKQNSALQQYEQILTRLNDENYRIADSSIFSKSTKNTASNNSNYYENDINYNDDSSVDSKGDIFPMILSIVSRSSEELNSDIRSHITDIMNDSSIPLIDRIESIISYVCHEANQAIQFTEETKEKIKQLKSDNTDIQSKCIEILSLFDEEIQFMQRLAHSNEIQSCVFFREDQNGVIPFDKDSKEELIKHCARVARYIEETIPQINIDEMNDAFSQFEMIQPTEIFNLLNANVLEKKLRDFYDRMKKFNPIENSELSQFSEESQNLIEIQMKELLCLFAAQAFTNDILQNHSVELRMRYEITQREIQQLRLEVEENKEPLKSMKKVINHFTKRENKIKRLLTKVLHHNSKKKIESKDDQSDSNLTSEDSSDDLLSIVKEVAVLINQNRICQAEKLESELQQVIDEKTQMAEQLHSHIHNIEAELSKAEKVYQQKSEEFTKTIEETKNDLDGEKEKNSELLTKVEELQQQLKEVTDTYNQLRANQQDEIRSIQTESDNQIQSLSSQLELKMKRVKDLEEQLNSFSAKIEELKKEKKEAKERIEYLETVNIKSVNALKEKSKNLRKQCEESIAQIQNQLQEAKEHYSQAQEELRDYQAKNEELAVELSNCQINKKAVELRLKALEDRLETTKQTMTSQHEARFKSLTTQIEEKLKQINNEQKTLINGFIQFANENLDAHLETDIENGFDIDLGIETQIENNGYDGYEEYDDSYLKKFLRYLQGELEARHHAQVVYEETAADVLKVQKLLKLSECQELYGPVSSLVKSNKEMLAKVKKCQDDQIDSEKRANEYCREMRKVESQIAALRQWESWARRVHRIVHETCCTTYSSEQLRLSLEESLLSSVSHRTLLAKLQSLREQKKAMAILACNYISSHSENVEGGNNINIILNDFHSRAGEKLRPSWMSLLAICAFIRRIQKLSGFIPIDYQPNSASSLAISCGVVESNQKKKKRNNRSASVKGKSFSQLNDSDLPQKKPTALFKNI